VEEADVSTEAPPVSDSYRAFLETVVQLRPRLHRFCARMSGSVLDGEDIVQETLFEAYRNLDKFDSTRPLKPWLFQIAYNRSIDFLRKHASRVAAESVSTIPDTAKPSHPAVFDLDRALEHLVISLPPKERACVLLKDVLDYSLEEVAEMIDSTLGGVKAALHRARAKLTTSPARSRQSLYSDIPAATQHVGAIDPELHRVIKLYVDRFNRRDWDGLRELIRADARLMVVDAFAGKLAESTYFGNYERMSRVWKMAAGEADGEPVVVRLDRAADIWTASSIIRLYVAGEHIDRIVDYSHCPWVISAAHVVTSCSTDLPSE
jgi:RNA polymerase sigma-70 factor (ECF subfamily)